MTAMIVCIFERVQWRWALNDFNVPGATCVTHGEWRLSATKVSGIPQLAWGDIRLSL